MGPISISAGPENYSAYYRQKAEVRRLAFSLL